MMIFLCLICIRNQFFTTELVYRLVNEFRGKKKFEIFHPKGRFCFVWSTCCVSSNIEACRQLTANPNEYVFVLENREYVKNDILIYSSNQLRTCPHCRTFSEQAKNRIFWRQGHFCLPVAHSFLEDSYFSCRACFPASNP